MKPMYILKKILLMTFFCSFSGCSDDEPQPGCYQEDNRKIIATIEDANGIIREPSESFCSNAFTIDPEKEEDFNPVGIFGACNLAEEFQIDGANVVFSGYVYESFETENICADFFEITEMRFSNP